MTRGCLLAIAFVVAFWIAFALFVASTLAAPRREAEPVPRPSSGASHEAAIPATGAVAAIPSDAPLTGNAGWAVPSLGASYLAVRLPRGTLVTVCGPGACWTTRTTDYGPSSRIKPSRVVDIAVGHWREP